MATLNIIDYYPNPEATEVPTNAVIWVQFDRVINWDQTLSTYWLSVTELDGTETTAVDGTISVSSDYRTISFTPNTLLKPNQKYLVYVFGGSSGVSAGSANTLAYLDDSFSWDFTSGSTTGDDEEFQDPTTTPEASGVPQLILKHLKILETTPEDGDYNQSRSMSSIKLEFNDVPVLPSGYTWFDMIEITRQGVLG